MRKKYQKLCWAIIMAGFVILPFTALAAGLQLETIFPKAPGMQEIVTGKTQLPGVIRYIVDWVIIIAALVTVGALIVAGLAYLTSRGRPEAARAAKERIKNCIYGLVIIAGSFLILQTINPQLTIMTIQKRPIEGGGIVMFTQAGLYGNGAPNNCYDIGANNLPTGGVIGCLNPEGVFGINVGASGDKLETLVKAGAARYLSYEIISTATEFGNLALESGKYSADYVNFVNFPLFALGFFGGASGEGEPKVFAYSNAQFGSSPGAARVIEYHAAGKMNEDGTTVERASYGPPAQSSVDELKMKLINIHDDYLTNFKSEVPYFKGPTTIFTYDPKNPGEVVREDKAHPPLSIRRQGSEAGVILYADSGAMQSFVGSVEDFNLSNVKFDNLADKIEMRNFDSKGSMTHDYLAILHSGYFFTGNLRLFLEQYGDGSSANYNLKNINAPLQVPLLYTECARQFMGKNNVWSLIRRMLPIPNSDTLSCDSSVFYAGDFCTDPTKNCSLGEALTSNDKDYYYPTVGFNLYGNIPKTEVTAPAVVGGKTTVTFSKINVSLHDHFGYLKPSDKASSLQLFELNRKQGSYFNGSEYLKKKPVYTVDEMAEAKKQEVVCREVKLCTGKNYLGDCLVFVPNLPDYIKRRYEGDRFDTYLEPMAPMLPIPIPYGLKGEVKTYDKNGQIVIEEKEAPFENKIKSISIDGACVVVLFENQIADMDKCLKCMGPIGQTLNGGLIESDDCKGCWGSGGPGANSEVFTESVGDLSNHAISKCGGRENFGFGARKNCASSIAIFPIKVNKDLDQ